MPKSSSAGENPHGNFIEANGLHIYYEEHGAGDPLIMLHGGLETSQMWTSMLPDFATQFRVIIPDSRGHGRTDNPAGVFSYPMMGADIAAFIKALGLSKPFIIGYSDGGQTALEMAMTYPGLVRGYMIGGIYHSITKAWQQFLAFELGMKEPGVIDTEWLLSAKPESVAYWQTLHDSFHEPGYWQQLLRQISHMWLATLHYSQDDLAKIKDPILFFCGDRDDFCPPIQNLEMYQMINHAELAVIPNADHFSIAQEWNIVQTVLNRFMLRVIAAA
ncbi:MAG: alpha/beta hydrolase [Anaerolineae bacterium]|nr:alpha/beta hydrolase [Anaerolineae bacterium]